MSSLPGRVVRGFSGEIGGFKKFLLRGNVVDLAVGLVIGAAFGTIIQAIVADFITPLIAVFAGGNSVSNWNTVIAGQTFQFGNIVNAFISFVLIAIVVYFLIVLPVNRLMDRYSPAPKPAPTKECPECLSSIPEAARRCRECNAQLLPPSEEVSLAMHQVAGPSGAQIADQAARLLSERLTGERPQ